MENDTIEKITDFLFIGKDFEKLESYDLVIVLGNNLYVEIAQMIQKLYLENKINSQTTIVVSGKKGGLNQDLVKSEAEIIYEEILKLNPIIHCILEKEATNIKENLLFVKKMVDIYHYKKILLIGKAFASRRILMCADALNYPIDHIHILGLEVDICKKDWYQDEKAKRRVLEELERISKYTLNEDIKM